MAGRRRVVVHGAGSGCPGGAVEWHGRVVRGPSDRRADEGPAVAANNQPASSPFGSWGSGLPKACLGLLVIFVFCFLASEFTRFVFDCERSDGAAMMMLVMVNYS